MAALTSPTPANSESNVQHSDLIRLNVDPGALVEKSHEELMNNLIAHEVQIIAESRLKLQNVTENIDAPGSGVPLLAPGVTHDCKQLVANHRKNRGVYDANTAEAQKFLKKRLVGLGLSEDDSDKAASELTEQDNREDIDAVEGFSDILHENRVRMNAFAETRKGRHDIGKQVDNDELFDETELSKIVYDFGAIAKARILFMFSASNEAQFQERYKDFFLNEKEGYVKYLRENLKDMDPKWLAANIKVLIDEMKIFLRESKKKFSPVAGDAMKGLIGLGVSEEDRLVLEAGDKDKIKAKIGEIQGSDESHVTLTFGTPPDRRNPTAPDRSKVRYSGNVSYFGKWQELATENQVASQQIEAQLDAGNKVIDISVQPANAVSLFLQDMDARWSVKGKKKAISSGKSELVDITVIGTSRPEIVVQYGDTDIELKPDEAGFKSLVKEMQVDGKVALDASSDFPKAAIEKLLKSGTHIKKKHTLVALLEQMPATMTIKGKPVPAERPAFSKNAKMDWLKGVWNAVTTTRPAITIRGTNSNKVVITDPRVDGGTPKEFLVTDGKVAEYLSKLATDAIVEKDMLPTMPGASVSAPTSEAIDLFATPEEVEDPSATPAAGAAQATPLTPTA